MFSNHTRLEKHTPANGIDRKEYISLLVDEFYETNNIGKDTITPSINDTRLLINFLLSLHRGSGAGNR